MFTLKDAARTHSNRDCRMHAWMHRCKQLQIEYPCACTRQHTMAGACLMLGMVPVMHGVGFEGHGNRITAAEVLAEFCLTGPTRSALPPELSSHFLELLYIYIHWFGNAEPFQLAEVTNAF